MAEIRRKLQFRKCTKEFPCCPRGKHGTSPMGFVTNWNSQLLLDSKRFFEKSCLFVESHVIPGTMRINQDGGPFRSPFNLLAERFGMIGAIREYHRNILKFVLFQQPAKQL